MFDHTYKTSKLKPTHNVKSLCVSACQTTLRGSTYSTDTSHRSSFSRWGGNVLDIYVVKLSSLVFYVYVIYAMVCGFLSADGIEYEGFILIYYYCRTFLDMKMFQKSVLERRNWIFHAVGATVSEYWFSS